MESECIQPAAGVAPNDIPGGQGSYEIAAHAPSSFRLDDFYGVAVDGDGFAC